MTDQNTQKEAIPLACDMTAIPLDQRGLHLETSRYLFSHIQQIRELPDGYQFRLAGVDDVMVKAAEFISLERLCCPFLSFGLSVEAGEAVVSISLTGREGVKTFIREEIDGLLGVAISWN